MFTGGFEADVRHMTGAVFSLRRRQTNGLTHCSLIVRTRDHKKAESSVDWFVAGGLKGREGVCERKTARKEEGGRESWRQRCPVAR